MGERRIHLSLPDTLATATLGPRGRPLRALLSAVGVAIGVAALVAMLAVPASFQADAEAKLEAWGANMIMVTPGVDQTTGQPVPLPPTAPAMVARIWPVQSALTIRPVPEALVYRNDLVPEAESEGISAVVAEGDPFTTLTVTLAEGRWFDQASGDLPTVVLGAAAADLLGAGLGQRVWIGQSWWAVIGVLGPMPGFSGQLDMSVFLAPDWSARRWPDLAIGQIMVKAFPGQVAAVTSVLARTANPADPRGVELVSSTQFDLVQDYFSTMFGQLVFALGGVALLIGGVGIANTMVVSVMERRGEIGLRRALGARTGQIALQFVLEAALTGLLGGMVGSALGAYVTFLITAFSGIGCVLPAGVALGGPGLSILIGALAGLHPALKAARQPPTVVLRGD